MELKGSNIDSSGVALEYVIDLICIMKNFLYGSETEAAI